MTDHELLELAAKAIGGKWTRFEISLLTYDAWLFPNGKEVAEWNPLTDDGDALRLAVKLGLTVEILQTTVAAFDSLDNTDICAEQLNDDPYAATRRAIVRAAAEIGRNM